MAAEKEEVVKRDLTALHRHWTEEFAAAKTFFRKWQEEAKKVNKIFLDDRQDAESAWADMQKRMNLFHSNIQTMMSMLYGSVPKAEALRTFGDPNDEAARVASSMATRLIQQDIQCLGEGYVSNLRSALQDRLIAGLGNIRLRYCFDEEGEEISNERVEEIYTHWQDILWSPARTYREIRWKAYRSYLTKREVRKKWGDDIAKKLNYQSKGPTETNRSSDDHGEAIRQTEVWEIWDKTNMEVLWFNEEFKEIIEVKDDFLELKGFWCDPPPLISNITTSKFMPRSDYKIAQDLYTEIDKLQTRISLLTDACKVVGVYDKKNKEVARIFTEGLENDLIPVDNWALLAERGGLKGCIDWVPIEVVANVIEILSAKQLEKINQLYEITGISDLLRGASQPYEAAATSKAKVQFSSIKIQALQEEFARYASDLETLKLEIMQRHFQPYCLIQQSNVMQTANAPYAMQAVQLLKNPEEAQWRIKIRPETLAMADYAQMKADRGEFIMGVSQFMQSMAPLVELDKRFAPGIMQILQWAVAGFKGSQDIESVLDQMITLAQQVAQEPDEPDPAAQKAQAEMQAKQQEMQAKLQIEMQKAQADMAIEQQKGQMAMQKLQMEMQQDREMHALEMKQKILEFQLEMQKIRADITMEREKQAAQFAFNTAERKADLAVQAHSANIDMEKSEHDLAVHKEKAKTQPKGTNDNA